MNATETPSHPVEIDGPIRTPRTVLVVDDDPAIRGLAALILESLGFGTFVANNGLEALHTLERHPQIDLVLLDLLMPVMNGEDTFRAMRQTWPEVAVVVISGFHVDEVLKRLGHPTPEGVVQKPFTIEKLSGVINRAVN